MSASRQTTRETFASLLNTALVGVGKPCVAVYDYQLGDFGGQSPIVFVSSAKSGRPPMTFEGAQSKFGLNVYSLVLYAEEGGWTEAQAEDTLDTIEALIAQVVADNQANATARWEAIDYDGDTEPDFIPIGGQMYRRERIPLIFTVYA